MNAEDDNITEWLSRNGRKALTLEAAKLLAADQPEHWYVAAHGERGFMVGKMTMEKFSSRHVLVDADGQPMLFRTVEGATIFLRAELKIERPHIFSF